MNTVIACLIGLLVVIFSLPLLLKLLNKWSKAVKKSTDELNQTTKELKSNGQVQTLHVLRGYTNRTNPKHAVGRKFSTRNRHRT